MKPSNSGVSRSPTESSRLPLASAVGIGAGCGSLNSGAAESEVDGLSLPSVALVSVGAGSRTSNSLLACFLATPHRLVQARKKSAHRYVILERLDIAGA